jgi:DNA polymerase I-like protein with 3'-5' exonuclease and polymerase domains
VHASVNQWLYEEGGTRSHRMSYANPPLQQAPSRGEMFDGWPLTEENAKEFRSCFLPEEGELWFSPDYSQQEYRHIVADADNMGFDKADVAAQKYRDDPKTDFHNVVVELTGLSRYYAKQCNFAKVFGAGVAKFAVMTDKTLDEAAATMGTYDEQLPFVKQLSARCMNAADRRGYIRMFDGARSHFDAWEVSWLDREEFVRGLNEGHRMDACSREEALKRQQTPGHPWQGGRLKRAKVHKAMNRRIQGNAARQMKMAMALCGEEGHVPLLQMHDELSFSLPPTEAGRKTGERISEIMRTVYKCSVPFLVDAEWGATWGDAKHTFKVAEAGWRENRVGGAGGRGSGKGRLPGQKPRIRPVPAAAGA